MSNSVDPIMAGESTDLKPAKKSIKFERHKHGTLFIVFVAYLLDCMLITVVVPILPDHLTKLSQAQIQADRIPNMSFPNKSVIVENNKEILGIGYIMCVKPFMQFAVNLVAGPLTARIGYSVPMLAGFIITLFSTITFAFASSFWSLFTARAIQGVGSAFTAAAGMGMLAKAYNDDDHERGRAMGLALTGVSIGLMAGPPYGGFLYHLGGIHLPFLVLAGITLIAIVLEIVFLKPRIEEQDTRASSLSSLLTDHQIIITAISIAIANFSLGSTEPTVPLWIQGEWGAGPILQGLVFFPSSVASAVCSGYFEPVLEKIGRWRSGMIGMVVNAICVLTIPFMPNYYFLLIPVFFIGWTVGMVQTSMFPTLSQIVDARHPGAYGTVYAIADSAICISFIGGPVISETLVNKIGFQYMLIVSASINVCFAPFLFFLRRIRRHDDDSTDSEVTKEKPIDDKY